MSAAYILVAPDGSGKRITIFPDGASQYLQGVVNIDWAHQEIHEGDAFDWSEVIILGSGATQTYLITTPDSADWLHFSYVVEGSFGITMDIYEGADRSGTTLQTMLNRNRNSANEATGTLHKGTSGGSTDGTLIRTWKSGTGAAGGKTSGTSGEATERILKRNTKYLVRITSAAASNDVAVQFGWYEHKFPA
jgi:hypothetical protein